MPLRLILFSCILVWAAVLSAPLSAHPILHLKSGGTMEYLEAETDGDFLKLKLPNGNIRLPKTSLAPESLELFYPGSAPAKPTPVEPAVATKPTSSPPVQPAPLPQTSPSSPPLDSPLAKALQRSGKNRSELEKALQQSGTPEMKMLVASAPPYDLVNITAEHLMNTVSFYNRIREEAPWGNKASGKEAIDTKLWQEYVLPYRIADEDLDNWRPDFFNTLSPLVAKAKDTKEAALIAHRWLYKGDEGKAFMAFTPESGEYRDMAPRQLLKSKTGKCFEMNMLMIALLRSVGVPSRLVVVPFWTGKMDLYHSWVEYWSNAEGQWNSLDAQGNPDGLMAKSQAFPVVYAYPGFPQERDLVGRERWELMENVTSHYTKTAKLSVSIAGSGSSPTYYKVYTFNYGAWRPVASMPGDKGGGAVFELADNGNVLPYLVSGASKGNLVWDTATLESGQEETLSLFQQKKEAVFEFPKTKDKKKKK